MQQSVLPLGTAPTYHEEDFIVSGCNRHAYDMLSRWPDWPDNAVILCGPPGSGKTHLAHLWKKWADATFLPQSEVAHGLELHTPLIVEDVEQIQNEEELFHLLNHCKAQKAPLLLTSATMPAMMQTQLADLKSRLLAQPHIAIEQPDDELLEIILYKQFSDRQLKVSPEILQYLVTRMERSFSAVHKVVQAIDDNSLVHQRKITLPFVREVLNFLT